MKTPASVITRIVLLLIFLFLLVSAFAGGVSVGLYYAIVPAGKGTPVRFDVAKGAPAKEVASNLEQAGLIRNALLFRAALRLSGSEKDLKPGSYLIERTSTIMDIINQLKKGSFKLRLVTVPEGLTLKEVAQILEKNNVVKAKDILDAANDRQYCLKGRRLARIEGFLLPETYDIPDEYGAADILESMIKAFEKNALPLYEVRKKYLPFPLSLEQVVTLASLVEREAQVPSERPVIARVYYNRLKKGMRMECDATIQYALGKQKEILKYSDLKVQSPYNTYLHKGLPPGPIANPGIECIRAVLNPAEAEYLYYVRNDIRNDGSHVFSRTFEDHNRAIKEFQK